MPATSKSQLRAMLAAAAGKSSLGIPASVGREFAQATHSTKWLPERKHAKLRAALKKRKK